MVSVPARDYEERPAGRTVGFGPVGMLVLSGVSLGVATALTKIALEQLTPIDVFGIEVGVSAVVLIALAWARGARPRRANPALLVLGVLEPGLAYLLFDLGVQRTTASHAALLVALDAPLTLALAVVFLRERVDIALVGSLALGVGGSVLVSSGGEGSESSLLGDVLVIAATAAAAAFTVIARRVASDHDPVVLTALQMLGALVIAVPVFGGSLGLGRSHLAAADGGHLALAVLVGLLGGIVPFLLFNRAIRDVSASRASLVLVFVPVVGAAASVLLLHETLTRAAVIGGGLALLGSLLAVRRDEGPTESTDESTEARIAAADLR
jgi:drug/metabolite transporter (DMT)-like permease